MEHLEFVDKLNQLGCSFRSTNIENKVKTVEIPNTFGKSEFVEIQNLQCKYVGYSAFSRPTQLQAVISEAIDMDSWKHSWHNEIKPENYEKFREIIQEKMIKRAEEMDFLTTVYFQLQHEISNRSTDL
ncbi:MAG: hypothetical protein WC389_20665 [Lutibacter sp.]|jgi:hypothetical protein